ncbi:MAG: cell filamentation protein Fic [Hyphomicrobiales bacterium]|nr:MAG: cell filamentation protein Fic [Hyphomicrobiales bacterium]
MNTRKFVDSRTGSLIATIEDAKAFVPAPLPPQFDMSRIAIGLADAMHAIGKLNGACRRLQNPDILVRPLQRHEALTSSAMEGTFTTGDDLLLAELGSSKAASDDNTREVLNYLTALNQSLDLLKSLPLSHRVIRQAHATLLGGLSRERGARKRPGEYKIFQNWIGGRTIDQARFVPPPPAEALVCMDQLEAYINRNVEEGSANLIDIALVHYQLETIHPFADGNGRVGRMLITLMAVNSGLLDLPALYISPVLEKQKDIYIDLMYQASTEGKFEEWLIFFFKVVQQSCNDSIETVDGLISLQEIYRELAIRISKSSNTMLIIDSLFNVPVIRITDAVTMLDITYGAAKKLIIKLVQAGVLTEMQGTRPVAFIAQDIIRASRSGKP